MDWKTHLIEDRRNLHQIPELEHEEHETQAYLRDALSQGGLDAHTVAKTGLMVEIPGRAPGARVAVRAEMDGLPLGEDTEIAFRSRHPGRMHACGHDGHMAMALAVARRFQANPPQKGSVRFLFQPAEEQHPGGALDMIADGCLDGVDRIIGLHLQSPMPTGQAVLHAGAMMANSDRFRIVIHGRGGHASEPEATQDAVLIGSQLVAQLQTIVSRRVPATDPAVVTCGAFHAGSAANIIADTAEILGTVRTLSAQVQSQIAEEIQHMASTVAALYGAQAEVSYTPGYPAVINNAEVANLWASSLDGAIQLVDHPPIMGGEDFSHYLNRIPGAFLLLGARPQQYFPHHSPHFTIDEDALPIGVELLYRGVLALL